MAREDNGRNEHESIWEPRTPRDRARQDNVRAAVSTAAWVLLGAILGAFMWWAIANIVTGARTASGRGLDVKTVLADVPTARWTRVPCHSPRTLATCTATPTTEATYTPTAAVPTATSVPADTATATVVPATPSVTATPCSPDPYWSCAGMERAFEQEVARLINEHRAQMGLQPFEWVDSLHRAEVPWAQEMVANNQCYHGDFGARAIAEGYTGYPWGEIGSCGYPNPRSALQGWLDSPGHRGVVEVPDMTQIGVGMAYYPNGYASTWAIVGRP